MYILRRNKIYLYLDGVLLKILKFLLFVGLIVASDQRKNSKPQSLQIKNTHKSANNLDKTSNVNKAQLEENRILNEYINDARKCSGYEN